MRVKREHWGSRFGIPLITAEMSLGRRSQLSPIAGMGKFTGRFGSPRNLIGWLGVAAAGPGCRRFKPGWLHYSGSTAQLRRFVAFASRVHCPGSLVLGAQ